MFQVMFNNWSGRFKRLQVEIRRRWLSEESILSSFTARINPVTMLAVLFLIAAFGVFATRALVAHFDSIAHRMVPIDTVNGLPYAPPVDLVMTAGLPGFWDNNRLLAFARDPDPHDVPMVARIDKSDGCTAHIAKETLVVASDAEISGCALIGKIDDGHGPVAELPVRINVRAVAASAMGWGYGGDGALGDGTGYSTHIRPSPVQSGASSGVWTLLAAGLHHSCAIDTKGRPWCWGRGSEGQVGAGRSSLYGGPEREPVAVHLPSNIKLTTIAVGDFHSCGADRKGALWCWGDNGAGQLGRTHKATLRASTPIKIDLPKEAGPVVAVAAGALHSCALDAKGNIHCFGYGGQGELGSGRGGPKASSATAVTVQKPDSRIRFVQLAAGAYHNCALDAAHRLWCWGADRTGKLGAGKILSTVTVPHEVAQPQGVTGWSFVATGQDATCAIDSIGDVWCWGSGRGGLLGEDMIGYSIPTPVRIDLPRGVKAAMIAVGGGHACLMTPDGRVWCWGEGSMGRIGNGCTADVAYPVPVLLPEGAVATRIATGRRNTLALVRRDATLEAALPSDIATRIMPIWP